MVSTVPSNLATKDDIQSLRDTIKGLPEEEEAPPAEEKEPIVIGAQAPFTGMPLSAVQERNGADIAVAILGGEIMGHPIEIIWRDTALDPARAARNAREMVGREADFLIGGISSSVEASIARVAGEEKVLFCGSDTGSGKLTAEFNKEYYPYYFRPHPSAPMLSRATAIYLKDKIPEGVRVSGIHPDYTWGRSSHETFIEYLEELRPDIEVVDALWPKLGTREYGAFISRLRELNLDVVFTSLWGDDLVAFTRQAKEAGYIEETTLVSNIYGVTIMNELKEEAPAGIITCASGYWPSLLNETNQEFRRAYLDKYGKEPAARAAGNFVAVMMLAQLIEKAGTYKDTEKLIDALETETFDSVYGKITFRKLDHQSFAPVPVGKLVKGTAPMYLVMEDMEIISGEDIIRPEEEVSEKMGK